MIDVLSYNEGSQKSIYFGFLLKLNQLLARLVPARIIIIIIVIIFIIRVSPKNSIIIIHGKGTRDYSASFPFLNWLPPLRLIEQLAIYFLVFLR